MSSRDNMRQFFVAMNDYTAAERSEKTAVIWIERGFVNRVSDDLAISRLHGRSQTESVCVPCSERGRGGSGAPNGWESTHSRPARKSSFSRKAKDAKGINEA